MSSQPSIAELRVEAEALGLGGEDALDFVYKQQEFYRNERAAERAARVEEAERATRAADAERAARAEEAERVARAAEAEAERAARAEEREDEIECEVRAADALEREKELKVLELTKKDRNSHESLNDAAMPPKFPQFKDGDDIVSNIIRFERIASLLKLDPNSYAVRIGGLLSGKALKIYAALSPEITDDYQSLKSALLSGFNKTTDSYRDDFKAARISSGETCQQFEV